MGGPVPCVLGIDPGRTGGGAAVLCAGLERPTALLAVCWTARGERFTVRWASRVPDVRVTLNQTEVYGIVALGTGIGGLATAGFVVGPVLAVVSESPYVGVDPQAALSVARTGAALEAVAAARLSDSRTVKTRTIEPTSWRRILGISAPDRETAKERSLRDVPQLVVGLDELLAELGQVDHVTDAAGVAAVGLRCAAWDGDPADWKARVGLATGPRKSKPKKTPKAGPKRPGRPS